MEPPPEALRRAIAVLAHELRNPLSVFRAGVDLLPEENPQQARLKDVLMRQTVQMTRLVEDLSDISRAQLGKLRVERRPLRLQDVIGEVVENLQPTLTACRQQLDLQVADELIWIDGDAFRIGQMLGNLLSNASKYSEPESRIELSATVDLQEVTIRARDFGIGIAEGDLARIFEFLSQSDSPDALDHRQGGLGIGLALARQIVEQHDGTITADSDGLGEGSECAVRLPVIRGGHLPRPCDLATRSFPPFRVLVVDDNRSSQLLVPMLIERLGTHEVRVAGSGEETLGVLKEFVPELILLDLGLPGMSGIELARLLRGNEALGKTHLVALTGYEDGESRQAVSEAGVDTYRIKPVSLEMLREIFEELAV